MLEDLKREYEKCADSYIKDWRSMNKNDLCRLYVQHRSDYLLRNGYFAAIIIKYWNALYRYQRTSPGFTESDFYTWLVRALTYILDKHPWDDPSTALYGDPQGPDKAVNRCIKSTRLSFYEKTNTYKRRANVCTLSIENLSEKLGDAALPQFLSDDPFDQESITDHIIRDSFRKHDYFTAFMVFNIVAKNPFEYTVKDAVPYLKFNAKRLARYMHNIDDATCQLFAEEYGFDLPEVIFAASTCNSLPVGRVHSAIKRNLKILGRSKYLEYLNLNEDKED